jgi:hypothetical protein
MGFGGRVGMFYLNPATLGTWAARKYTTPEAIAKFAWSAFVDDWRLNFLFTTASRFNEHAICPWMGPFIGFTLMPPIVLVCLPWTRARSKIRSAHILRAASYAFAPLVLLLALVLVCDATRYIFVLAGWYKSNYFASFEGPLEFMHPLFNGWSYSSNASSRVYAITLFLWYLIYWYQVLRHGWRMADYRPVYIALIIPAILLTLLILVLIPGAMLMTV